MLDVVAGAVIGALTAQGLLAYAWLDDVTAAVLLTAVRVQLGWQLV